MITREQVLENRKIWINFLKKKDRKKAYGALDEGGGKRCCLGHACYVLGIERRNDGPDHPIYYGAKLEDAFAPDELIEAVGLWDNDGSVRSGPSFHIKGKQFQSLAAANDAETVYDYDEEDNVVMSDFNATPQQIGAYLESVIQGGDNTPFIPLSKYKKAKISK